MPPAQEAARPDVLGRRRRHGEEAALRETAGSQRLSLRRMEEEALGEVVGVPSSAAAAPTAWTSTDRPSAPPRQPLAIPACRDDTASAQNGARDRQWRRCGDLDLTFAELGEDGYSGKLALAGGTPTHGGPGKMKRGRKSRRG
ncbi:Os12g0429100 [Oryza sativa Japonica Group]|uniref:Os12g0429100 protein n=1 Tax=Oryza sativa subsp. japonica TaxID=39947 RepID=Q2QSG9_ORYSJ|nr:hypothetical protein LOC_Os12g24150 [Oryza sativa Japonica Group]BAT16935.1 Os12g0429100 [Oryza sativa Japonica Group]